jgi:hypothetical protein
MFCAVCSLGQFATICSSRCNSVAPVILASLRHAVGVGGVGGVVGGYTGGKPPGKQVAVVMVVVVEACTSGQSVSASQKTMFYDTIPDAYRV